MSKAVAASSNVHQCECKCNHKAYAAGKVCAKCHFNSDHDNDTWVLKDGKYVERQ